MLNMVITWATDNDIMSILGGGRNGKGREGRGERKTGKEKEKDKRDEIHYILLITNNKSGEGVKGKVKREMVGKRKDPVCPLACKATKSTNKQLYSHRTRTETRNSDRILCF